MKALRKCLFPVAGYGTRFLPATKALPKEMLPILDKPLVQYGVEEAVEAGLEHICFVTGRGKRAIEDHFDTSFELEHQLRGSRREKSLHGIKHLLSSCTFAYTRQTKVLGLGHAVLTGEAIIGAEPFAVVLADDLCFGDQTGVLMQMASRFSTEGCSIIAVEEIPPSLTQSYGIIAGEPIRDGCYRVSGLVEKPKPAEAPSNLAVIGRYILTPDIFRDLERTEPGVGGEIQLTDALNAQALRGGVIAYQFAGKRFDCGSVRGFVEATNHCFDLRQNKIRNHAAPAPN